MPRLRGGAPAAAPVPVSPPALRPKRSRSWRRRLLHFCSSAPAWSVVLCCAAVALAAFFSVQRSATTGQTFAGGVSCCSLLGDSAAALLACANSTVAKAGASVVVLTQVVGIGVTSYAAPAALMNAIWAERHGYQFRVAGAVHDQPGTYDSRYGKVSQLRTVMDELLAQAGRAAAPRWLLWLDADAAVVDPQWRIDSVTSAVGGDVHFIVCAEANMETNTRVNSGTMLLRVSPWARAFLHAWWTHPDASIGAPDQWTFDSMWDDNQLDVRRHTHILPATAFNSEPPFYATWTSAETQPVIHLMGDADTVRRSMFSHMASGLCTHRTGAQPARSDSLWPPTREGLVRLMHAQYRRDAENGTLPLLQRAHATERLGMLMGHLGRDADRAAQVARTLAWRESVHGADSPDIAHDVQVLANLLSILGRHAEALPLALRALALTQRAVDPKGRPQLHLVAAAHGDLGSLYGRMGDRQQALHHLRECLALEERIWGADNAHSADTHYNIALTLHTLGGDTAGAVEHYRVAAKLYARHLGQGHPSVVRATQRLVELGHAATTQ